MKKKLLAGILSLAMVVSLTACGTKSDSASSKTSTSTTGSKTTSATSMASTKSSASASSSASTSASKTEGSDFDKLVEAAKGTEVSFYGWGGDDNLNAWLDDYFAKRLKDKYDITLKRVPMDIDKILSQLSGELQAGKTDGDIDMIWINGENFKTAKENNMLFGPFAETLPNFEAYINKDDKETYYDFAYPIDGYEAPYGKAQLVFFNDSKITPETPKNTDELLEFAKKYKGKVTYGALPDFTASAFVRNVIYDICGTEQFANMKEDKATVKAAIEPALEYLRKLNPYLWQEGKTFPSDTTTVTKMFADGELVMSMSYTAFGVARNIENGTFTDTTRTFQFDKGTIGNTNYIAIASNSGNSAGAQVVINEMMDPEVQAERYKTLKIIPVVQYEKLNDEQKKAFDSVDIGKGVISQDELLSKRLPEMPAGLVPIIEEIWNEEVVGK